MQAELNMAGRQQHKPSAHFDSSRWQQNHRSLPQQGCRKAVRNCRQAEMYTTKTAVQTQCHGSQLSFLPKGPKVAYDTIQQKIIARSSQSSLHPLRADLRASLRPWAQTSGAVYWSMLVHAYVHA